METCFRFNVFPLQNLPSPLLLFLFLSLSSAKIQYGTQIDISLESTRTASYTGYELITHPSWLFLREEG